MNTNILILSDTHGNSDLITEVLRKCRPDILLYAGDGLRDLTYCDIPCPLYAVRGNCDWSTPPLSCVGGEILDELTCTHDGVKILLMHGHTRHVKSGLALAVKQAVETDADILVFGHTHMPLHMTLMPHGTHDFADILTKPLHIFNPGSLREYPHSFGTITIRDGVPLLNHGQLEP